MGNSTSAGEHPDKETAHEKQQQQNGSAEPSSYHPRDNRSIKDALASSNSAGLSETGKNDVKKAAKSVWKDALLSARSAADAKYEKETRRSKVTNKAAVAQKNADIVDAFVALGVSRGVAEQAIKRGSGAVEYILTNCFDELPAEPIVEPLDKISGDP